MRRQTLRMLALACAAVLAATLFARIVQRGTLPDLETQHAIETDLLAQRAMWRERNARINAAQREELAENDPARSGLVGLEWSGLTTSPGYLDAKRVSTHPLWVWAFQGWYREADLRAGDTLAIGTSGSFPALFLAARIAAESMELRPVMIASLTSSNYGANVPEFDLWDMENVVQREKLVRTPLAGLSPGGDEDAGRNLEPQDRQWLLARLARIGAEPNAPPVLIPETLGDSIQWRNNRFFAAGARPKLFVNIGGNSANHGEGIGALRLPKGLSRPTDAKVRGIDLPESVAREAWARGIPVLHVLDVRGLAVARGVPLETYVVGELFSEVRLPVSLGRRQRGVAAALALCVLTSLMLVRRKRLGWKEWAEVEPVSGAVP